MISGLPTSTDSNTLSALEPLSRVGLGISNIELEPPSSFNNEEKEPIGVAPWAQTASPTLSEEPIGTRDSLFASLKTEPDQDGTFGRNTSSRSRSMSVGENLETRSYLVPPLPTTPINRLGHKKSASFTFNNKTFKENITPSDIPSEPFQRPQSSVSFRDKFGSLSSPSSSQIQPEQLTPISPTPVRSLKSETLMSPGLITRAIRSSSVGETSPSKSPARSPRPLQPATPPPSAFRNGNPSPSASPKNRSRSGSVVVSMER